MFKTKKSTWLIALVVLVGVFAYYQFAKDFFQSDKREMGSSADTTPPVKKVEELAVGMREVSGTVSYETPNGGTDNLRFVVTVDKDGIIQSVQTLDAETNEVPEKKKEFNAEVNVILKGKKLSELTAIDKVGKSSLTTKAFNDSLDQLKAAL